MLVFLWLTACGAGDITTQSSNAFCEGIDISDPPPTEVAATVEGRKVTVVRMPVFQDCAAVFAPEITRDGNLIQVDEAWEPGTNGNQCCMEAAVDLVLERGTVLDLEWSSEDGTDTLEIDAR